MGWTSTEEYVRYMVPHIGITATADALNTTPERIRERWPDVVAAETRCIDLTREYATSAAAVAKHRARKKAKFADATIRCERCGKEVARASANQRYCPECSLVVRREKWYEARKRKHPGTGVKRKPAELGEFTCERCGETFKKRSNNQRYCDSCRISAQRELQAKYREQQKALRRKKPPTIIHCERCGQPMVRHSATHRYCESCATVVRVRKAAAARERSKARKADSSPARDKTE